MTRLPSFEMPGMPTMGGSRRSQQPTLTPEEEMSLAGRAGRVAMSGLGAVGNVLNLPGSMIRDVLALENPLDQLLSPTTDENRTSGRDLLRKYGLARKKDTWGNFFGGLGVDILTDPFTYVMPTGAFTKGGQIVKNAGLANRTIQTAATKLGRSVTTLGKREAGIRTTVGDIMASATPDELAALNTAAQKTGVNIADVANDPLRGALGLGFFGKTLKTVGTGDRAAKYAAGIDKVGSAIRYSKIPGTDFAPVDNLALQFQAKLGQVKGKLGQVFSRQAFDAREATRAAANVKIAHFSNLLNKHGWGADDKVDTIREIMESVTPHPDYLSAPQDVREVLDGLRDAIDGARSELNSLGGKMDEYISPDAKYFPRHGVRDEMLSSGTATSKNFNQWDPNALRRNAMFSPLEDMAGGKYGIKNETTTLRKMIMDSEIDEAIEARRPVEEVAAIIKRKYGNDIPRFFREADAGPSGTLKNRYEALAGWMAKLTPEQRAVGFFANHPVADAHTYLVNAMGNSAGLRAVHDMLDSPGALYGPGTAAKQTGWKTLDETLEAIPGKIDKDVFAEKFMQNRMAKMTAQQRDALLDDVATFSNKQVADLVPEDITAFALKNRVSEETAAAVERTISGFTSPKPVGEIIKAFDSLTNVWKAMQTGLWPAFHSRNAISGQLANWMAGTFSGGSLKDTWSLIRGGVVDGAERIPAVQREAAKRGITNLTREQATDILGELAYANNMTSRYTGEVASQVGMDATVAPQKFGDILREIPGMGRNNASIQRAARKVVGRDPNTNLKPWQIRGVAGRTESAFGPMAAAEEVGAAVESLNRVSPFIKMLREGVDPAEAARRVLDSQVAYDARYFTGTEREVLQRLFPFMKFTKGISVWAARELMERPGGKLAQVIRGTNAMRGPNAMTPDYVAETASVPLGTDAKGHDRYLTGMGMMHEDPASFLGGGVRGALLEAGSRLTPAAKMPLEWMTGQSFFQKGPVGGRQLEDLDPTIGRTIANLTGQEKAPKLPEGLEFLATNLVGRPLTTLRTMTYPVRDPSLGELAKVATNLGTGMRITSVSPAAKDTMLRERAEKLMKQAGGKTFIKTYIPADVEAQMTPRELADAQKLEALTHLLSMRAKERAEAKKRGG